MPQKEQFKSSKKHLISAASVAQIANKTGHFKRYIHKALTKKCKIDFRILIERQFRSYNLVCA